MTELFEFTASKMARQIRRHELSPVDLVKSLFHRINVLEPKLKAWVFLDHKKALEEATHKETQLYSGENTGVLHGVPVGLKDIFFTEGVPTTACSKLYADLVPSYDATSVALLKQAGAIILGKTVTTEFACTDPSPTVNPWNSAHTPGGSSSGSAVAVASQMCPAALGSQTVGSVLRPASYNGVVGFKPTFGRVSRYGVIPVSWSLDTVGWMVRTVEDAALLLQVLAGPDPQDPVASRQPIVDYLVGLNSTTPPHIGLLHGYFYHHSNQETQKHFESVVKLVSQSGAKVEEIKVPDSIEHALADQQLIMAVEGASFHQQMFEHRARDYQPKLREMISKGLRTDAVDYSRALERRRQFINDMELLVKKADVLLMPSTPTPPLADLSNTGDAMFQGPWTSCGFPAISIPSGLAVSGLPLGIQLVAAPFAEGQLLSIAHWLEEALNIRLVPAISV